MADILNPNNKIPKWELFHVLKQGKHYPANKAFCGTQFIACKAHWNQLTIFNWQYHCEEKSVNYGSFDHVKVIPTPVLALNNLWRQIHMFLNMLEFKVENKEKLFRKKNVLVMWSQTCGNMA